MCNNCYKIENLQARGTGNLGTMTYKHEKNKTWIDFKERENILKISDGGFSLNF